METRKHPRYAVKWPVTYSNEKLLGHGTVVNVCHEGCRIAGTMAAVVGMRLKLRILPSSNDDPLCIEETEVRWAKEYEFGLEFRHLASIDHRELMGFIETCPNEI